MTVPRASPSPLPLFRRMLPRDPGEPHRVATPLELFVDLTFVVAVAQGAASLHHALSEGHARDALTAYPSVFFAIWWAWMNFTWFASAYDTDDVVYRAATFVQLAGVLVLAAGVPRAFDERDFAVVTLGYVIMRVSLIGQWWRAGRYDPHRACARRYARGIALCQVGWITLLALPSTARGIGFVIMAVAELAVPVWAEHAGATPWHPTHISERYGLFTIIVLGETILAATMAVQHALDAGDSLADLAPIATGGLLIVFAMWWIYFDLPVEHAVGQMRQSFTEAPVRAFIWGYGHLVVFASAAAVGAGITVAVDHATGASSLSSTSVRLAVTVPVALYLLTIWVLHAPAKANPRAALVTVPTTAALILASTATPEPVLFTGLLLTLLVVVDYAIHQRQRDGALP